LRIQNQRKTRSVERRLGQAGKSFIDLEISADIAESHSKVLFSVPGFNSLIWLSLQQHDVDVDAVSTAAEWPNFPEPLVE
jgi:hypothetical protein